MKKIILAAVMLFAIISIAIAQNVGIGTNAPAASALLDVTATNKGVLVPRMNNAQMIAIASPANGLLIYNTDSAAFAYRTATSWVFLKGNATASNDWSTKGNAGTDTSKNFIGTTDNVNVIIKRNNERSGLLTISNTSFGFRALRATRANSSSNTAIGAEALQANDDGNQNTAIGRSALSSNISGIGNIANGYQALYSNEIGSYNTASGGNTLYFNTTGSQNTAYGFRALTFNETGNDNTAIGTNALFFNTNGYSNVAVGNEALNSNRNRSNLVAIGDSALYSNGINATDNAEATKNTAVGSKALFSNNTGYNNTATGYEVLKANTIGYNNTAIGGQALGSNDIGSRNTATGFGALFSNASGNENAANGTQALLNNIDGSSNTAMGFQSLYSNNSGQSNVAIGAKALYSNTDRSNLVAIGDGALYNNGIGANALSDATFNTAVGFNALFANTTGNENTAVGTKALTALTWGSNNIAVGSDALHFNETGSGNVALGSGAGFGNTTGSGNIFIGNHAGADETGSNKLYIANSNADANNALVYGEFNNKILSIGGKMGIGTTAPANLLHIKNANTDANASQLIIEGNSGFGNSTTSAIEFRSNFTSANSGPSGRIKSYYTSNNYTDAQTVFQTIAPGPAFVDAMILSNGNVSIPNGSVSTGGNLSANGTFFANGHVGIGISPVSDFPLVIKSKVDFGELIKLYNDAGIPKWHLSLLAGGSLNFVESGVADYRLLLGVGGEVGIGKVPLTSSNDSRLQVKQKGTQNGIGVEAANSTNHWDFYATTAAASNFALYYNGNLKGTFDNVTGAYTANSDRRLKKDITTQLPVLNNLMQLQAYQYHYADNKTTDRYSNGFMAQDVQKIFPDAVVENEMKDGEKRLGINYQYFTVLAIKGLQEQQKEMEEMKEQMKAMMGEIEKLKNK